MTPRRSNAAHRVEIAGSLAVVTGAANGIGRATAIALAELGARVVAVDLDGEGAERSAAVCSSLGPAAIAAACDVADYGQVEAVAAQLEGSAGLPDVLVNNAGVGMSGRFVDVSVEDWRWIRSINLDGVVHGCAAFVPAMVERGRGHVVNVASGFAYAVRPTEAAYVTTKAAVLAFSRCLQADLASSGVGVSVVCPGVIKTGIVGRTRFFGSDGSGREERVRQVFAHGHDPALVARAIVGAVERNAVVVPVGWEARLGWGLQRVAPVSATQFLAQAMARLEARNSKLG